MPSIVKNKDVETCLRNLLLEKNYKLSEEKGFGELGTDIIAEKNDEKLHIEVIGYKEPGHARAKDYFEVFFRTISMLNDKTSIKVVMALPKKFRNGLPRRAMHYKVAWSRIGKIFPELEIWLIDIENEKYQRTLWNDWLD